MNATYVRPVVFRRRDHGDREALSFAFGMTWEIL